MKILLWKIGALGDILMTTPLVRQLRRALPGASIDYLTGHRCKAILAGNPHIDRVIGFDESILYGGQARRLPEVLPMLRGYDCVFTLDKHWIFSLLARVSRVPMRVGFRRRAHEGMLLTHTAPYAALRHEIDYYLDLLEAAGWPVARDDVALDGPALSAFTCDPATVVLINSGGDNANEKSQVRRMPDSLFGELVRACAARSPVAFVGSASEAGYYDRFAGSGRTNLCGRTNLAEATAVLRQAARVITTDTGLMHLAAAVNRRVTGVFGPTHPMRKCPPGASWVWGDQGIYEPRYELFGIVPRGRFFESLTVEDILERSLPSPFMRCTAEPA
ncbi:glycosyltransferase family 9 protein [Ramlibacter henchirensis]|uniref:Glycosyltransferase family 9 protein n=1 Tax=Ramlibacter henchirensis TaxID=204072 RepID=A0A4Z0C8W1_9BURK|nr:glycosyltransferase family 9 protein [Ramlibacter henchirensis]TFZ06838.1 glycosyltransferase family 9 protein [Ramlibacter henchirensis]